MSAVAVRALRALMVYECVDTPQKGLGKECRIRYACPETGRFSRVVPPAGLVGPFVVPECEHCLGRHELVRSGRRRR